MNLFIFTGNLGKDSEVKVTPSGKSVCSFSVAVKSGYGDKEKTTWVRCALLDKRAEGNLPQYLKKGTQVAISGELSLNEWEKDGITNKMLNIKVDNLDLIGGRADATGGQGNRSPHQGVGSTPPPQAVPGFDEEDDIPFS